MVLKPTKYGISGYGPDYWQHNVRQRNYYLTCGLMINAV